MDAMNERGAKCMVNGSVRRDTAQSFKRLCANPDMEMGLAAFPPARMTTMLFAFVGDLQFIRGKGRAQPDLYFVRKPHLFAQPSSKLRQNT